jgi:hypothetical protein
MFVTAADAVVINVGGKQFQFNGDGSLSSHQAGSNIGWSNNRWATVYAANGNFSGEVQCSDIRCTPGPTTFGDTPVVYSEGNGIFYRKINCATYSGPISSITVENGLVTAVS